MLGSLPHADIPHDLLVSGSKDCSVKVWDLQTPGPALFTMHGHVACINCVAVESNLAASASDDCSIRVWDITMVWFLYFIVDIHLIKRLHF